MKTFARTAAIFSSLFCLAGGLWLLKGADFSAKSSDALPIAMGLYFVGKAFFVGPMLFITAEKFFQKSDNK